MLAGAHPAFDGPVILFQNIIEVPQRSMLAILLPNLRGFGLRNRRPGSSVLVGPAAGWFSPLSALARKRSAAAASRLAERRKSIVAPLESTGPVQVASICPSPT
jgi:hypothetical protein